MVSGQPSDSGPNEPPAIRYVNQVQWLLAKNSLDYPVPSMKASP